MKYVSIGGKFNVSQISLGCMRMAGHSEKEVDEIIFTALERGVNHFDHADIYGGGNSERCFGAFLKRHPCRDGMIIQTKCGIVPGAYDFSYSHIIEAVNGSLSRLGIEHIDMLLLHRPDTLMEPEKVAKAFDELYTSGKVGAFGVSNHNPMQIELLKTAVKQPIVANQLQLSVTEAGMFTSGMNVNMKNQESVMHDGSLLEYSRINKITIQAWSPFQHGFFAGVYVGNREKFPRLNDKLTELAEKYGVSENAIVAAWIMRHPAGIQVISGTMNPAHLSDVCDGANVNMSRSDWYEIYRAAGHCLP
mgnify:CR=1 FL=1